MSQCGVVPVSYTHLDVYKRQEYEGSFIYDEVPDRQRLFDEADRIAGRFISEQSSRCFICTIAGILFNCELCRRRCRYSRYQRFW